MDAEYGSSASDVRAEFIWAEPPAANDNALFGGGDHIAGYAPLALIAPDAQGALQTYWVHGNHLGVPIVTTDTQGSVVDPGNDFLRPGFPGQSQVLSDLYYNRNRDYDPVTGRYIQADPIGLAGDVNPYVYANADPVNGIDPLGLMFNPTDSLTNMQFDLIADAGEVLGAANARNAGRVLCFDRDQIVLGFAIGAITSHPLARIGRIHGNSLNYIGETHVYVIRGPNGVHKIGESMLGVTRNGVSRRGGMQARRLSRKTGKHYQSEIRRTFPNKRAAREYERRFIETYRRLFGEKTLPGNKTNR